MIHAPGIHVCGKLKGPVPTELITFLADPTIDPEPPSKRRRVAPSHGTRRVGSGSETSPRHSHPLAKLTLDLDLDASEEQSLLLKRPTNDTRHIAKIMMVPNITDNALTSGSSYNLKIDLGSLGFRELPCDFNITGAAQTLIPLLIGTSKHRASSMIPSFHIQSSVQWSPVSRPQALRFVTQIDWYDAVPASEKPCDDINASIINKIIPDPHLTSRNWTFQDFYNSVYSPPRKGPSADGAAQLAVKGVACKLYPFQRRTVCWLLEREGLDQNLKPITSLDIRIPHPFIEVAGLNETPLFVSLKTAQVTSDRKHLEDLTLRCAGGLLAEEMGLGKTVEMLSLIDLHQRHRNPHRFQSDTDLEISKATIIVSPDSIQQQWKSEIEMHSPHLQVIIYKGMKGMDTEDDSEEKEMIKELSNSDVVLVSYHVLSKEVHYAAAEPDRTMRHARKYRKPKSPLIQIDWWRCILDECQMIDGGLSQAAQVAHQIPRRFSWAVSGTPMKREATDLTHIVNFLRVEATNCPVWWSWRLVKGALRTVPYKPLLDRLFNSIAIRHTKEQIKDELVLPPQKRLVMTMPFTAIEEQRYADMFQEMCEDCGLSLEGAPLQGDWNLEGEEVIQKMRMWLARLRQTVLHPEVGERNRKALGRSEGPLRTVSDVLRVMMTQNETAIRVEERSLLFSKLRRGQILEHARKPKEALLLWQQVLNEAQTSVEECRRELNAAISDESKDDGIKKEATEDDEHQEDEMSVAGVWRSRLRSALEVLHTATFFVANAYYQIKSNEELTKPDSEDFNILEKQETDMYERAKQIRKELLGETQAKASIFMDTIKSRDDIHIPSCKELSQTGGFESRHLVEKADDLYEIMDNQKEKMDAWRDTIKKALLTALIDQEDEELQGDEYETSTKHQDEVYVYIEVLRAVIADRHDLLTGQSNALIDIEMRRNMEAAKRDEGHSPPVMIKLLEERLAIKPKAFHGSFRNTISELRSLRTTLDATSISSKRAGAERDIVHVTLTELQENIAKQTKMQTEIEKELELFMSTSNARLDFYRQLQSISDSVAPFEKDFEDQDRESTLTEALSMEAKLDDRLQKLKSRGRYLLHLSSENDSQAEPKHCIICRESIEIGILTACGHQFCKECLRLWWNAHKSCPVCKKSLGRDDFHSISYKPQVYSVQEETDSRIPGEEGGAREDSQNNGAIYTGINSSTLAHIQNIDLPGSYGTKIDTLARHLLYLRQADPGAKSIIFSQFRDFLDILGRAFRRFRIGFASVDEKGRHPQHRVGKRNKNSAQRPKQQRDSGIERFIKDPGVECFFLHARAQAAGLNLVNATHVFLCEPLINTALELQAIARVHRIGQHQPTTVYMYLVDGTVEKAIYDISVRRRLEHVGQVAAKSSPLVEDKTNGAAESSHTHEQLTGQSASAAGTTEEDGALEAANREELQQASLSRMLARGATGGELVPKGDLWDCLFQVKGIARPSDEAQRAVASFLGANAAEQRQMVERPISAQGCT